MDRLHAPRRSPMMTLAALALLAPAPGCGSDTPAPSTGMPTPTVAESQPAPMPTTPTPADLAGTLDQAVHQSADDLKHDATKDAAEARKETQAAEGDVKHAIADAEGEARRRARSIEADARKSAEDALDKLLPAPK